MSTSMLLLIACFIFLAQAASHVQSTYSVVPNIPAAESDALLQFKTHLSDKGSNVLLMRGWDTNNTLDICKSWQGLKCGRVGSGFHIVHINLTGWGLGGSLAPQLGNLIALSSLDLSNNSITGFIPPSLSNCSSLGYLDLRINHFTGAIPGELGILGQLQTLQLSENSLTGFIPRSLGNCTNLSLINLTSNHVTGPIPAEVGLLRSLTGLILWGNSLTGDIPWSLENCTNLFQLDLSTNMLTGSIPTKLGSLRNLTYLYLNQNNLTGAIPNELGLLSRLSELVLRNNNLTGPIPASLGNCTSLTMLDLQVNELTGPIPAELGLLSSVMWLGAWGNNLTGAIPSSLGNCTSLISLELSLNLLTGLIPMALTTLKSMMWLYLDRNNLSGFERLSFGNLTSLIELDVCENELSGTIPSEIGQIQTLQYLSLSSNQFVGEIPWNSLANCSSLCTLHLSDNRLSGGISSLLGRFQALREIYLQNNFLEGVIPTFEGSNLYLLTVDVSFNRLNGSLPPDFVWAIGSSMYLLNFSNNHFTGLLPIWFEKLMMVQFIDFSHNHFVGTIPEGLGNCIELVYLNLAHNNLAGELPVQLSNLTSMKTLDLSINNLTGALPLFLEQLHSLKLLNVSFNSFNGAIPLLGVFKNLSASSFLGNPGLCGPIIEKVCVPAAFLNHNDHNSHPSWKKIAIIALPSSIIGGILIVLTLYYCHSCCICNKMVAKNSIHLTEVKKFTAEELSEATQGYSESNLLGEGALSTVHKGWLSTTGKLVAVKRLKDVSLRDGLLHEMQVLSKLRHRNLVRILGCVLNLEVNALVLEYMSNGTLEQYLYQNDGHEYCDKLCWERFMRIAIGIANALVYVHHEYGVPIIHGDVKPSNILLDAQFDAHLADFGLAKLGQTGTISVSSNFKGSLGYMAPEYAYAARISTKVDVYSYGVVILEMLTGKKPTQLPEVTLHKWVKMKLHEGAGLQELLHPRLPIVDSTMSGTNKHMAMQFLQLGVECTRDNPRQRPTMQGALASLFNCQRDPALQSSSLQTILATST